VNLQAFYTLAELVELTGVNRWTLGRELEHAKILQQREPGAHRRVWLDDLRVRCPRLWSSILTRAAVAKAAAGRSRT
jgi:hypothetical protein